MDLHRFFEQVAKDQNPILATDYDGTLCPLQKDPAKATPYEGVTERLKVIQETRTTLMVVTGRPAKELLPLLALQKPIEVWGVHGWEQLLPDGNHILSPLRVGQGRALERIAEWIPEIQALGGRCEMKYASMAIHWRDESEETIGKIKALVREKWLPASTLRRRLAWHDFNGGIEFRVKGRHKGQVIETALTRSGTVAYLGDDFTDEDGFRALQGRGLGILVGEQPRDTFADVSIRPPGELLEFLDRWILACT